MSTSGSKTPGLPEGDLSVTVRPPFPMMADAARENRKGIQSLLYFGLEPAAVRREAGLPEGSLILSGHQPVLFHPGLWAKPLAASLLGSALGAHVVHKITDTDEPGEVDGAVPENTDLGIRPGFPRLSFQAIPYAFQKCPSVESVGRLFRQLETCALKAVREGCAAFGQGLQDSAETSSDWVSWHASSLSQLDEASQTRRNLLVASKVWDTPSFRRFMALWLQAPERFASAFNRALARYRAERNIRHPLTPVPDLGVRDGWMETPFWAALAGSSRGTLWISPQPSETLLRSGETGAEWVWDRHAESLEQAPWALWPKALPQSLYTRLYLCDYFIHGLGGGAYEPANDLFLEELGEKPAPAYGSVSATLYLDPAAEARTGEQWLKSSRVPHWLRAFDKNPEYLVTRGEEWGRELPEPLRNACARAAADDALREGAAEKQRWVSALSDPVRRTEAGRLLKETNARMALGLSELRRYFEAYSKGLDGLAELRSALAFREYAYFCYPPGRFVELRDAMQRLMPGA